MRCDSYEEIGSELNLSRKQVKERIDGMCNLDKCPKSASLNALYQDEKFQAPIYNIWRFKALTNGVHHPGNSEQSILDNLIYAYTDPFDIVVDPFAGGGSTIDVCKNLQTRTLLFFG